MAIKSIIVFTAAFFVSFAAAAPQPATPTCTTVFWLPAPHFDLSQTTTTYLSTITETSSLKCSGCSLETSTRFVGHGPVVPGGRTATVTLGSTTSVTYVCATTPEPVTFPGHKVTTRAPKITTTTRRVRPISTPKW